MLSSTIWFYPPPPHPPPPPPRTPQKKRRKKKMQSVSYKISISYSAERERKIGRAWLANGKLGWTKQNCLKCKCPVERFNTGHARLKKRQRDSDAQKINTMLARWRCGAAGSNMVKDSKGQKKLEDFGGGLLPAAEGHRLEWKNEMTRYMLVTDGSYRDHSLWQITLRPRSTDIMRRMGQSTTKGLSLHPLLTHRSIAY